MSAYWRNFWLNRREVESGEEIQEGKARCPAAQEERDEEGDAGDEEDEEGDAGGEEKEASAKACARSDGSIVSDAGAKARARSDGSIVTVGKFGRQD